MRRLAASDLLPERAGQPVKAWAHMSLADLLRLEGSSALQEEWTAQVRAAGAARRAEASEGGSDGGAWLDGDAAEAVACDAAMAPIVTGDINAAALEDLIQLCAELHRRRADDADGGQAASGPDTSAAWEALEQAPSGYPPVGLDPGAQPGRDDHGLEQGPDQGAAQPRTTRPGRVMAPWGTFTTRGTWPGSP